MVIEQRQAQLGLSLIEVAVLMAVVAAAAVPIMDMQSGTMKADASIKFATLKQTAINNLIESASSTGRIITSTQPNGIDLDTIASGGTLTTAASQHLGAQGDSNFWYQWNIRDVSYKINTVGNLETPSTPILVAPTGTRIFSASLAVYNSDPNFGSPMPIDTFQTTLRTNKGTSLPAVQAPGIQILFDNSGSMDSMVKPSADTASIGIKDAYTAYKYPGQPGWNQAQYDPSIPNHSGGKVNPTSAVTHEATSLGGWVAGQYKADAAKSIRYCSTTFPHLTYRYKHLSGQGAGNFPTAYGLNASETLNPFDNERLDLTMQKSYPGAPSNRTYPGPGVLGMPASGQPGACDSGFSKWGNPSQLTTTSKFGRWYYMAGTIARFNNLSFPAACKPFKDFMGTGMTYKNMRYNAGTGQYNDTGLRDQLPLTPFAMFNNAPEKNCMYVPIAPPWNPIDIRQHFQTVCNKNPNDADFDDFSSKYLTSFEMARNGILKFLVNIEQNQLILDNGKIGMRPFNPIAGQFVQLSNGGATSNYVTLHPDRPKLFETLRVRLLSINRYGAQGGCLHTLGVTPTYQRLLEAANELKSDNSLTSRFVVMFTDGNPTDKTPAQITAMVQSEYNDPRKPIQLFNIGISGASLTQLKSWSDQTQTGASFYAGDSKELDSAFTQVSLLIQRQFLLDEIDRYHLGIG